MKNFLFLFALTFTPVLLATPVESGFAETTYVGGLAEPTSMAFAPDGSGRLFVTEKSTGVRIVQGGALLPVPFATFPQLYTESECGVLSAAFDPSYAVNHYVYVFVTVSSHEQRIVRFTDVGNVGTARTTIIGGLPTLGQNHDGGALGFGPDGKLYWAIGDLGDKRGVDGDLQTLAAKVGRANADGSVPSDNPFRDGAGPNNDYIWATGYRNPFTMTFQPRTGELWLNVVGSTPDGQTDPVSTPGYEQVFRVQRADDGGYDDYEGNQPVGARYQTPFARLLAHPVIQYKTDTTDDAEQVRAITSAARVAGKLTVTTTTQHPFRIGQAVTLTGALAGTYVVRTAGLTSFTAPSVGADVSGASGTVQPFVVGSTITGGCFYESTAFPEGYRGNFFHGDYSSGVIMRAQLDAQNKPVSYTPFITDAGSVVDTEVGPDGALYYLSIDSGEVRRVATTTPGGLIVSPTAVHLVEGGSGAFTVRLASAPASSVEVTAQRADGDTDLTTSTGPLTFTPQNWDVPQTVNISAAADDDTENDDATFLVTTPGLAPEAVEVTATDTSARAPVLSVDTLTLTEGAHSQSFQISLTDPPTRPVTFVVRRTAGPASVRVAGGRMIFTANNYYKPRTVRVFGKQDRNTTNELVTLSVIGRGYDRRDLAVSVLDNDPSPPHITSAAKLTAVIGLPYTYQPAATGLPAPTFTLPTAPSGMSVNATSGLVTWPSPTLGTFPVTLRATNTRPPAADQIFTLAVAADTAPTARLTAPIESATVSGANAEFFGNGSDDYRCVKAEFYVDNVLAYTDENTSGHYHYNGQHAQWDTTALANGAHTLKMIVFDDKAQTGTHTVHITIAN